MLESFFLTGPIPSNAESGFYMPLFVLASYAIAVFGSYTGLTLAVSIGSTSDIRTKNIMHACGAFALGSGIWAMHFVGMLAFKMKMMVTYDAWLTVLSMLIAIAIAHGVLYIARSERLQTWKLAGGAVLLGIGICSMHYTGMAAMNMDADLHYRPDLFLLSVAIAITASGAALWIIFFLGKHRSKYQYIWRICAALIMGAAICGMHYTGMAAAVFTPFAVQHHDIEQSYDMLALAIVTITSVIFGISIAFSMTVSKRGKSGEYPFPIKLLVFSSMLTLFSVVWATGNGVYFDYEMSHAVRDNLEITGAGDDISHIDSIMMHALRMYAATGDQKWEKVYYDNARLSNEAFGRLKMLAMGENTHLGEASDLIKRTEDIDKNTDYFLQASDAKTLELAHNGKLEDARNLLAGEDYIVRKQDYSEGLHKLGEDADDILIHTLTSLAHTSSYSLYPGIVVITILPIVWYFSFRSIRRWREELENARRALIANERELQRSIGEIEQSQTEAMKAREDALKEARTVAILRSVAATANRVSDINEAIEIVLKLMCEYMGCPIGHAYIFDTKDNSLRSSKLWFLKDEKFFQDFVQISEGTRFKRGVGLPGRVWEKLAPVWVTNLSEDMNFPRLGPTIPLGIQSGMAFPLVVGSEIAYVLEFFFTELTKVNDDFLHIMQEIGNQLVRVIERSRAQETLKQAKESAEKANESKSEFLANMSHELRTPLNSILGMLRLLKEGQLSEEEHGLIETAFRSSTNLLEIVNDILDLSKIEANEMQLERIGMDPNYALYSVVLTLDHIAREKQISLMWHKDKEKFPYVLGDPTRFTRVLTNLIGNAIKYTDKGHVDVRAFSKKLDDRHIEFRCEIMDTGIGIAKEKLQTIFDKFVQADTSTTRKYGGTGLGLAITRQLVELMGGTIGVESEVGVGSTFWFTIPFEITDKLSEEKHTRKKKMISGTIPPPEAKIIVAEDHPMNQILMTKLLKRFGIVNFVIAENGVEAVKRYRESPWDVILMDCHMPEKNGYDATEEIRNLEKGTDKHIPIVAMTANAMVGDKEKCLRYGMDEYISKPINIDELKEILGQWIYFQDFADNEKNTLVLSANAPVDMAQIRSFSEGDKEMEKELIRVFVEQSDMNLQSLYDRKTDGGSKEWQGSAHMFKGGAAGVGAKLLSDLCDQAQHFIGTIPEQITLYEKISNEYYRVKDYFIKSGLLS